MKTKSLLKTFLALCVLAFALFGSVKQANAYSFSATLSSGQTMYYNIIDATNRKVALTCPNAQNSSWDGYTKPTGNVVLSGSVSYNGITYTLTSLGNNALEYCPGITALTIPSTVTSIASTALFGCTNMTTVTINSNDFMSSGFGPFNNLVYYFGNQVTSYIFGSMVTTIGSGAFSGCTNLTSVTFIGAVTSIGSRAFEECYHLTRVYSGSPGDWCTIDFADYDSNPLYFAHHLYSYPSGNEITNLTISGGVTTIKACAFYGAYGLTSVTLPSSVTSIENEAFFDCINLTQVTIPSSVTSIANYAFSGCSGLTRVNISNLAAWCAIDFTTGNANPLSYAHHLYLSESEITNLTIPSSVTYIKNYTFYGASGLTSVTIPSSVVSIGKEAFYGASGLTQVTIPTSLTSIGEDAFHGCSGLMRVNISNLGAWCGITFNGFASNPLYFARHLYLNNSKVTNLNNLNNATSIGSYAFCGCTDFTALTIASSVTSIGNYAFDGCSNITSVTNSAISIGSYAFKDCSGMTELTFLGPLSSVGNKAFNDCTGLTRVNISYLDAWSGISFASADANPLYLAHHLYHNNTLVTNLDILSTATSIGSYAFSGCIDFTSAILPNSVQSIGSYAFSGCTGITSATIPSNVQSIGNDAFSGCTSLTSVTINSNAVASASYSYNCSTGWDFVTNSIYYYDFTYNNFRSRFGNQVTSYTLGPDVTAIGTKAFYDCDGITELTFLGPLSSVGSSAFEGCSGLTRVNVSNLDAWCSTNFSSYNANPLYYAHHLYHNNILVTNLDNLSTANSVGTYAFSGCTDLTSAILPNSVQSIRNDAFSGCTGITSATIPSSVQSIGNKAFTGCTSLTSVTINSNAVASASYSYNCSSGWDFVNNSIYYYDYTYDNFRSRFGNQVTSYTIGPEVTAIGANAFYNCDGITELTVCSMTPPTITNSTFSGVPAATPVYVPLGTVAAYQAAQYWSRFTNFIESASVNSSVVAIPYEQHFDDDNTPEGWNTYSGTLYENNGIYTATLTPCSGPTTWRFGEKNDVFDSHAYALLGYISTERKWMVTPTLILGNEANVYLSFDLGMSKSSGSQVPLTPGAQNHQRIVVLVTTDGGATWQALGEWRHEDGYMDLDALNPEGDSFYFDLSDYQNQNIQVAFYTACPDPHDQGNHVHVDNVSIQSYDMTMPPTSVTVSEVGGHSAKVNWTPASPVQSLWDVWVTQTSDIPNASTSISYMQANGFFYNTTSSYQIVDGLNASSQYTAWVRYRNGQVVSEWVNSGWFETENACAPPTNIQVQTTTHTVYVSWEPGEANQTSWTVEVWDSDYPWGIDVEGTPSTLIDVSALLYESEQELNLRVCGHCGEYEGDGCSPTQSFSMQPLPTLTVNDGTSTSYNAVINAYETFYNYASTQFVIPANEIMDMQYGTIQQLQFYCSNVTNGTPWGNAQFRVYLKEVDFGNYSEFCDDSFYPWSDMSSIYEGSLIISDGVMTITPNEVNRFYYQGGDLLVGIYQYEAGSFGQAQWYGVVKNNPMSGYIDSQYDEDIVQCSTFAPKVTFTYELDDYLPPTNFMVYDLLPDQMRMSWTPREGQTGAEVELLNEDMESMYIFYAFTNPFGIGGLEPSTTYNVRIRALYVVDDETHYSTWTNPIEFTTLGPCEPPANLTVTNVGPFSAQLNWVSGGEYDEVQYSNYTNVGNVLLEEGFENCATNTIPEGWLTYDNAWRVPNNNTSGHNGGKYINANNATNPTPKWLVLPQFDRDGYLSLWINMAGQSFGVYISTTGTDVDDFQLVQECQRIGSGYQNYIIPIMAQGYRHVAIMYQGVGIIRMDDVTYYQPVWTPAGIAEGGQYLFNDLTPGATYQARVSATCETGYSSEWTTPVSFSTPGNIEFEDEGVESICLGIWDTNQDNYLSYAEASAVQDLDGAFEEQDGITSFNELQYFTGLTAIGNDAFAGCTSLNAITLPNTITSIDSYAFGSCSSLQSIVIPPSVTTIGDFAFSESGLTEADLPHSVTSIGTLAFGGCNNLVSVYVPASVTNINGNAFTGAVLANIDVDAGNPVYDSRNGCNTIIHTASNTLITGCKNSIVLYGVTTIGLSAFENCTNLTDITLPATVGELGDYAFLNCTNLHTIEVDATTPPTIGQVTFGNLTPGNIKVYVPCGSLETYQNSAWSGFDLAENCNIVFEDNLTKELCVNTWDSNYDGELSYREAAAVTELGEVFYEASITRFNELQYFTGLNTLDEEAFYGCSNLIAVTLPETVTWIDNFAFYNCTSLASITIGEQITNISGFAFYGCTGMAFIKVEAETCPELSTAVFNGVPNDIPVYVPCGSVAAYQTANGWSAFTNYLGEGCSQESTLVNGWNWWAPTVEMDLDDLETGLGTNGLLINSQDGGFARNEVGEGWSGTLSEIEVGKMYKIKTSAGCTLSVQGDRPAVVTVTLEPGYTWFGYTKGTQAADIATALGYFVPATGDMIIGENGTATYTGGTWTGNLTELVPGHGYVYFSTASTPKTVRY